MHNKLKFQPGRLSSGIKTQAELLKRKTEADAKYLQALKPGSNVDEATKKQLKAEADAAKLTLEGFKGIKFDHVLDFLRAKNIPMELWGAIFDCPKDADGDPDYSRCEGITEAGALEILKALGCVQVLSDKEKNEVVASIPQRLKTLIANAIKTPRKDGQSLQKSLGKFWGARSKENQMLNGILVKIDRQEKLSHKEIHEVIRTITNGMTQDLGEGKKAIPGALQIEIDQIESLLKMA